MLYWGMSSAQIVISIVNAFRDKKFLMWLLVLIISATGPLITTYIFSRGVNALETNQSLKSVVMIFFLFLGVSMVEAVIRIAAKTRLHWFIETKLIRLQEGFIKTVKIRSKHRRPVVQSVRNLTRAVQTFSNYFINSGVAGLVSFISVPFILYFVDKQVFFVEMALILVYLVVTYFFAVKYEKQFERYDESRERYFIRMQKSNKLGQRGRRMGEAIARLQDIRFFEWVSVQNTILVFQFIITFMVVVDIVNGYKGISDLVLIIGYVTQSQRFLNSVTGDINRLMQVRAGIERLVITSHGAKTGSVTRLI